MKKLAALLALFLLAPIAVRAQQDSLNGWKISRVVGSASGSMRQVTDTATEGNFSQGFNVSIVSNSGAVEFEKDFGRDIPTPDNFRIDAYTTFVNPSDVFHIIGIQFFLISGDSVYQIRGFTAAYPLVKYWYPPGYDCLVKWYTGIGNPPKNFRKMRIQFTIADTTVGRTAVDEIFDNLRTIYWYQDPVSLQWKDSTVVLDRFGDPNPVTLSPSFSASAKELDFDSVTVGESKGLPLTLKNSGNDTLKLASITSTSSEFSVGSIPQRIVPGDSVIVTVTFKPDLSGSRNGYLIFRDNAATSPDSVSVSGIGKSIPPPPLQPALSISDKNIDFGNVPAIASKDTAIILRNMGNDTLQGTISIVGNGFSVKDTALLIPPMDSVVKMVRFSPEIIGKLTGLLIIRSNDPTSPDTVLLSGFGVESSGVPENPLLPRVFSLSQNYPNPFNPATTISFALPSKLFVSVNIFDALGRVVSVLVFQELPPGRYSRQWNATYLPSGVYFYRLQAGTFTQTKKLLLLK